MATKKEEKVKSMLGRGEGKTKARILSKSQ
jgi:hypothetical protein